MLKWPPSVEAVMIKTANHTFISATIYKGYSNLCVIIASATGVRQEFYKRFAKFLVSKGIHVVTFDYSGIGGSLHGNIKESLVKATDWGKYDLEAVIQYAKLNYPNFRLVIVGHSVGGQLIGMAASSVLADKIILVAAQSGYWKWWKGLDRCKILMNWFIFFPVFIKLFGYLPSKRITGMENLPINVAKQWRNWCIHPDYFLGELQAGNLYFDKITNGITAISIEADAYAPVEAVNWLTGLFTSARIKKMHLQATNYSFHTIGHFGIFKEKFKRSIWNILLCEIEI